ncbi:MAG: hypothetical protein IT454_09505 [Planctomycetes bacterium]|nr:hypothetical protein [Planctomycetota bacterium]
MSSRFLRLAAVALAATSLAIAAEAQTIGCATGGTGGVFPATGTGGGGTYPTSLPTAPSIYTLNVASLPPGATHVSEIKLLGLTHTWLNDVHFVLTDPSGATHNLLHRPTGSCDFSGDYVIVPACTGGIPWGTTCTTPIPVGTYDQYFGTWASGTLGIFNTPLDAIPAQTGTWTLTAYDWVATDSGNLTTWEVCFGTPLIPSAPSVAPALATPANAANVLGPSVNLTWASVACATSYEVDVDGTIYSTPSTSFAFASSLGSHTWTARGINVSGAGPWATSRTFNDVGVAPTPCSGVDLNTIYLGTNGGSVGGQLFFDLNVTNPAGINMSQIDVNSTIAVGTAFGVSIYTIPGTSVGFENNSAAWTLAATGNGVTAGTDQHSLCDFPDFLLPQGSYGIALVASGISFRYTNGTGANQVYSNADVTLTAGKALNVPWTGTPFTPRVFNGTLRYNCTPPVPPIVTYCTAGTSTNGCVPAITASAQPSVTLANPCLISVSALEGQKNGLLFYGVNNSGFTPNAWGVGGTSFLCVKAPTQRMSTQSTGGNVGQCDGALSEDWNAYQGGNPGALGNPFAAGQKVYVQAWYRDPAAVKTTNLSNGLELTCQP